MNWDDLRVALAVHRAGSYAGAAARLGIDESTVARRLARLQRDLGFTLFEAVQGGRRPTAQCLELLAQIDQISKHIERIDDLQHPDEGPVGRCRIAATDSVSAEILAPAVPDFLAANPGITLQLLASTENVNFSRWEADLAVRLAKPEKGDFSVAKLGEMGFYLFEPRDPERPKADWLVCAYPEDLHETPEFRHLAEAGLDGQARCLTKNLLVMKALLRSGACCAVLPTFMAAELLVADHLKATRLDATREVWLLIQDHLKQDPATRSVIDWLRGCFAALEG